MGTTILLIDDSQSIRDEMRQILLKYEIADTILESSDGLEGFKMLISNKIDLVLCDLVMPQIDGYKFLQMKTSRRDLDIVPLIILTATTDVEQKVKLLSHGAQDYITKPFHEGEFLERVRVHLKIKQLQDDLRAKNDLLLELSTTDSLTKIYNRRHFLELAQKEFNRSERLGIPLSFLIFDVDLFKTINDTFGHLVGDDVLVKLCDESLKLLRKYDIMGRYGGDEFTILFPQTDLKQAFRVADRLFKEINKGIIIPALGKHKISLSGGLAERSQDSHSLEDLIKTSDNALYTAKQKGRGRIEVAKIIKPEK